MKLIEEAVSRAVDALEPTGGKPDEWRSTNGDVKNRLMSQLGENEVRLRLRLDWELTDEEAFSTEQVKNLLKTQMLIELSDLVANGDTDSVDMLLRNLDGVHKRNASLAEFDIFELISYRTHVERKGTFEYTVFMNIYLRFE